VGAISGRGVTPDIDLGAVLPQPNREGEDVALRFCAQVFSRTHATDHAELLKVARQIMTSWTRAK
jgi:hypothetical protein